MTHLSRTDRIARKQKALALLGEGLSPSQVAAAVGAAASTVRRWRREKVSRTGAQARRGGRSRPQTAAGVAQLLRAEGPAVARVLLDLAKDGDVRAAALVMKLVGNELTSDEEADEESADTAVADLERRLQGLSPAIASEIVGLLAQAESEAAERAGGNRAEVGRGEGRRMRLPWRADDRAPDEGQDSL